MKNLAYFIVGLVYLPITLVIRAVTYIRDLGDIFISNYKICRKFNKKD